jgi:hypothetical protein
MRGGIEGPLYSFQAEYSAVRVVYIVTYTYLCVSADVRLYTSHVSV